jgi:4-phospho-D-threonate 3-dehydrogenase / 4-phospho-D-erythronate 3-dehydrogenase
MEKKTIAISVGDINGIGIELALKNHTIVTNLCNPIYCINQELLKQASELLKFEIPQDFHIHSTYKNFKIKAGKVSQKSGLFSYFSFLDGINLVKNKKADGVCTLPINKKSWQKAGIKYVGHTDMLRDIFKTDAIMMLGCQKMFVALFSEHIPLKDVPKTIQKKKLYNFFLNFYNSEYPKKVAVLGLNPHAGDDGVLGDEEKIITKAIKKINKKLNGEIFFGPFVPDTIFTPDMRKKFQYFIAMYHDQGLAPLKALYFDEGINVSLGLPIKRTSVDHGTAFDKAYKENNNLSNLSYINSIKKLIE